jgi:two-component system nitrogen regulation sensor histidine kinase GlnL
VRWVGRLGGARAVGASGAPRFDRRGRVAGAVLLLRDRTDPLGLVGPARQSADRDSFATVAAGVAHEVRNPLGGIRGAIQLLEAELGPGSQLCEHARVALREVDRLVRLTEQLLDLGRPPRSLAAPIHLHVLLDEVLAVCQRDPAARGVTFERIYDPSLPGLSGDAEALARLFLNLLRNAVEATGGRGRVAVSTGIETGVRLRAPSGGSGASAGVLRVSIADDGPGIPPEIQERLFLPFATGKPGGTGLGLALSRKVAIDHGGWIVCASAPGHGATFTVYLPAREGPP